jgi:nitroreductase
MKSPTAISSSQLLQSLEWRYATKAFDPDRKIPSDLWGALEDALVLTASSGGLQPWAFVVVTDPSVRAKLAPASFGQRQITEASHLVVFAARTDLTAGDVEAHVTRTAEVRGVSAEKLAPFRDMLIGGLVNSKSAGERQAWASRQTNIALGNLLTSAALLGIDACPMEGFLPPQYDEILGLAQRGLTSVSLCALGYRSAADPYASVPKVRFPKDRMILHV